MKPKPLRTKNGNMIGIKGTNRVIGIDKPREATAPSEYPKKRPSYIIKNINHCA